MAVDHPLEPSLLLDVAVLNRGKNRFHEIPNPDRSRVIRLHNWDALNGELVPLRKSHTCRYGSVPHKPSHKITVKDGTEVFEIHTGDHKTFLIAYDIWLGQCEPPVRRHVYPKQLGLSKFLLVSAITEIVWRDTLILPALKRRIKSIQMSLYRRVFTNFDRRDA